MFGRTGQTTERWRVAGFVGMLLLIGACVQIAGIDDPHPKDAGADGGQGGGPDGGGPDGGQGGGLDAGPDAELDPEWANWPMPNPADAGLPNSADYTIGTGTGVVTDNVTHLIWQRQIEKNPITWTMANAYCKGLTYGGYPDGWRLPTAIELVSLVDFTKAAPGPVIDADAFPETPGEWFWTATPAVSPPNTAWVVSFNTGQTSSSLATDAFYVRCVR